MLRYTQILRFFKSKYWSFFPAHRFFRHAGMDVSKAWRPMESEAKAVVDSTESCKSRASGNSAGSSSCSGAGEKSAEVCGK
jgi:hypothetical protein